MQQAGREPGYNGDIHERDQDGLYLIAFGLVALAKNVRPRYLADAIR